MTIYDIAKEAGVSAATVSRVINNRPGIKQSTREEVYRILEKYSFSVSATARGLVRQSSMMIGLLISDIRNLHYTEGAYIIEREMLKDGYCSLIMNTGVSPSDMACAIRTLSERRVDGAVLIGSAFANDEVRRAIETYMKDTPFVMENGRMDLDNVVEILADDKLGSFKAARYLAAEKRRRLCFINSNDTPSNRLKVEGFLDATGGDGVVIDSVPDSYDGGYDATMAALKENPDIDGIIYAVDILALGGVRAIRDMGLSSPGDISIFGFDNSPYSYISNPRLSSIDSRLDELSISSAAALKHLIRKEKVEKSIVFPPKLVLRETTLSALASEPDVP